VRRLRCLLDSFAAATSLHINFHKSTFVPIGVDADRAGELALILECPISALLQMYLGSRSPPPKSLSKPSGRYQAGARRSSPKLGALLW
jgi:hypothetical protein